MNAAFLSELVAANLPTLGNIVNNGECRFLTRSTPGAVDAQGFLTNAVAERTHPFLSCSWSVRASKTDSSADETVVGGKAQAFRQYEITVARQIETISVSAEESDRLEFRETCGGKTLVLEITGLINQANAAWLVHATLVDV